VQAVVEELLQQAVMLEDLQQQAEPVQQVQLMQVQ
jgi:hypothetical protein